MKFAERLAAHITPEWNSQYIKYDELKDFLYSYEQNAPILDEEKSLQRYYAKGDEQFFYICDQELLKINTFFAEKLAESQRKYANLKSDLVEAGESLEWANKMRSNTNTIHGKRTLGPLQRGGAGAGRRRARGNTVGAEQSNTNDDVMVDEEDDDDDDDENHSNSNNKNADIVKTMISAEMEKAVEAEGNNNNNKSEMRKRGSTNHQEDANSNNNNRLLLGRQSGFAQRLLDKNRERQHKQRKYRKENELKLAFSEFYLSLILLQNYQTLNATGFRKILKKHDKIFRTDRGTAWYKTFVVDREDTTAPFASTKKVDKLIADVESLFTEKLENGNKQRAMERLRVPPFEEKLSSWTTFRLGLYLGMVFALVPVLVGLLAFIYVKQRGQAHEHEQEQEQGQGQAFTFDWKIAIKLYRSSFLVITHIFFIGINSYGWSRSGVNHVLIFEIDPRNHLTYQQLLEASACLGVFWFVSILAFALSSYFAVEYYIYPLLLQVGLFVYMFNPIKRFHASSRTWLQSILWRIVTAPFYPVQFADFWLADQLTSFGFLFSDMEFFACWFLFSAQWAPLKGMFGAQSNTSPCMPGTNRDLAIPYNAIALLLAALPSWLRFLQCLRRYKDTSKAFPHLANAAKYSTVFFDIGALSLKYHFSYMYASDWHNPFFYLWLLVKFFGTCYKFLWDVKMDWGFFDKNAGENKFLREVIVYSSKSYYYAAIVENFVFRFIWLVRLYDIDMPAGQETYKDIVTTLLGFCEIFRRFVWNFFRLENEHLNNCGQFRAVRDISIRPMQVVDLGNIEKMMDDEDGVVNRQYTLQLANIKNYNPNMTVTKRFIHKHPNLANITKRFANFNATANSNNNYNNNNNNINTLFQNSNTGVNSNSEPNTNNNNNNNNHHPSA